MPQLSISDAMQDLLSVGTWDGISPKNPTTPQNNNIILMRQTVPELPLKGKPAIYVRPLE